MNKRFIAARIASLVKLDLLPRFINRFKQTPIPVLAYHRILDEDEDFPFDKELISANCAQFREQMEYIKKHFQALRMSEYIDILYGRKAPVRNAILITFDDGFDDNYHNAFSILDELGIPATFFVTTSFINSREVLWYEALAYFFNKVDENEVAIDSLGLSFKLRDRAARAGAYNQTVEALKLQMDQERESILNTLFEKYGSPIDEASEADKKLSLPMTWEQAKEMIASNMDIGSHSVNHSILSRLDQDAIAFEMTKSKQELENVLGCEILSVAYPVGQNESINNDVLRLAEEAGYQVGFNYIDSVDQQNLYSIGRIHVESCHSIHDFKSKLYFPGTFCE